MLKSNQVKGWNLSQYNDIIFYRMGFRYKAVHIYKKTKQRGDDDEVQTHPIVRPYGRPEYSDTLCQYFKYIGWSKFWSFNW